MKRIIALTIALALSLSAVAGSKSETLRTKDGKLIRAGEKTSLFFDCVVTSRKPSFLCSPERLL